VRRGGENGRGLKTQRGIVWSDSGKGRHEDVREKKTPGKGRKKKKETQIKHCVPSGGIAH